MFMLLSTPCDVTTNSYSLWKKHDSQMTYISSIGTYLSWTDRITQVDQIRTRLEEILQSIISSSSTYLSFYGLMVDIHGELLYHLQSIIFLWENTIHHLSKLRVSLDITKTRIWTARRSTKTSVWPGGGGGRRWRWWKVGPRVVAGIALGIDPLRIWWSGLEWVFFFCFFLFGVLVRSESNSTFVL